MDNKIINFFDGLELEEADRLLDNNMKISVDKKTKNRIKNSVFQKTGIKVKRYNIPKKLIACAAAVFIVLTSLYITGFDNVTATINKVFALIPGYGIIEKTDDSFQYVLSNQVTAENDNYKFTLNNAYSTKNSITVMLTLETKNISDDQLIKVKQISLNQAQNNDQNLKQSMILYAGGNQYAINSYVTSSTDDLDLYDFTYTLKPEDINNTVTYKIDDKDINLSLEFKLINYKTFNTLEQIGATGYNNDISITAVPTFSNNKVEVTLYPINKSKYEILPFYKPHNGYKNEDINLETDSGIKSYIEPQYLSVSNPKFTFNIDNNDNNFTLKIPYIIVHSTEDKNITLPIPKAGQIIAVNKKVAFQDSTMTIVNVTLDKGNLKMTIKYDNKTKDKIMRGAKFVKINSFGTPQGNYGYTSVMDENDIFTTVSYDLTKEDTNKIRLRVFDPEYFLTDAYTLKFSRK